MLRRIIFQIKKKCFFLILLFIANLNAQTFTDSNLPIVIINTDINPNTFLPYEIVDSPVVLGSMKIIKHQDGSRNYLTDQNTAVFLNYNGRLSIQIRGSSSQSADKKGYGLTTIKSDNVSKNNVSLLGMPSENDWILNGLAFEPSLIRDYLAYNISRLMGNYATRTEYCEVVINGQYNGLYLLQEKVKADSNRVNVTKITTTDITGENLTGGYITKADKTTGNDPVAWSMASYTGGSVEYIHEMPSPYIITSEQNNYIYNQFTSFQNTATAQNSSLESGYPSKIDVPTFIDFMLSNEFGANPDGYQFSTYFHKDRNGKLRAGPIWDFNLTLGNDLFQWGFDRSKYYTWQFSDGGNDGSKFWTDLFNNTTYKCYLSKRFHELIQTGKPMNATFLNTFIDNTVNLIGEAIFRENQRWGTIPNHELEIVNLKTFINNRITWMTSHLGSYQACTNVYVPPLVISKINYNPDVTTSFPVSNDQEFIEITNAGSTTVTLSGIYFKELGITYQFPYSSTIAGNSSLYLASNAAVFQSKYGFVPFGQFTRNLSNKSEKLILIDAFGNLIDTVEYFDSSPWPTAPDGNGSYLQLISTNLDNNLASSWQPSSSPLENKSFNYFHNIIVFYPNPASTEVTFESQTAINSIEIYDIYGQIVKQQNTNSVLFSLDINNLSNGIYLIKALSNNENQLFKLIKRK